MGEGPTHPRRLLVEPGCLRASELEPIHTRAAVVTGDIQTENDAIRLRRYGYPVRQITTAGACHPDARMVEEHIPHWLERDLSLPTRLRVPCRDPSRHFVGRRHSVRRPSVARSGDAARRVRAPHHCPKSLVRNAG